MAQDFLRYLASRPTDWKEALYRVVVLLLIIWGIIRIRRVETITENTNNKVEVVATAVTTEGVSTPPVYPP